MGSFWSQPIRVECTDKAQLITCRTINSALWFVNNKKLEQMLLAYLAKYCEKYRVLLYAFAIVGNHYHMVARFPNGGRSEFFRDFNARIAQLVHYCVPNFLGGPLFERRFTPQILPLDKDVENYFIYCALQAVSSGLCKNITDYNEYNSFHDASCGITRKFKLVSYGKYNAAKRTNPKVSIKDFEKEYILRYARLPGYENVSRNQYKSILLKKTEARRQTLIADRLAQKKGFLGRENLNKVSPGSYPHISKKGGIRPLVLSENGEAKANYLSWYFQIVEDFRSAVRLYRSGSFDVHFPIGTFRPPGMCINCS